jgi:hypothetical protein
VRRAPAYYQLLRVHYRIRPGHVDKGNNSTENVNMVVDLDPEKVILVTTNDEYKMIELEKGTHNFEQNNVFSFEKIQNNSDDVIGGDTVIRPNKYTSFKIQSKLCARHSFDYEKNENPGFFRDK